MFLIPLAAFFSLALSVAYGSDYWVQRVGLLADVSDGYSNLNRLIQQAVLAEAMNVTNIIIVSSEKDDLRLQGIKQLNGALKLKIVKKNKSDKAGLKVQISSMGSGDFLLDDTVEFNPAKLSGELKKLPEQIVQLIALKFPPKKKEELVTIEAVKITVSEFEPQAPVWKLSLMPAWNTWDVSLETYGSNGPSPSGEVALSSLLLGSDLSWNYLQYSAALGVSFTYDKSGLSPLYSFSTGISGGYGWLGSLIVTGLEVKYNNIHINPALTMTGGGQTVPMPDVHSQSFYFSPYLQFNITRDYYIMLKGAVYQLSSMDFSFDYQNNLNVSFNRSADLVNGPPYIELLFNFTVWDKFNIIVSYDAKSLGLNRDNPSNTVDYTLGLKPGSGVYLRKYTLQSTVLGLGLEYEF